MLSGGLEIPPHAIGASKRLGSRWSFEHLGRVRTYRDTGSVEPGSEPIFGSVSGSENLCDKDTVCLYQRYILWFFRNSLVCRSIFIVTALTLDLGPCIYEMEGRAKIYGRRSPGKNWTFHFQTAFAISQMNEVSRIAEAAINGDQRRRRFRFEAKLLSVCHFTSRRKRKKESSVARNTNTFTVAGAVRTTLWSLRGSQPATRASSPLRRANQ